MKSTMKLIITLCIIALVASVASAETRNEDLPSENELISLTENFKVSDNYVTEMSACIQNDHPTRKYDIWEYIDIDEGNTRKVISVYYRDPTSSKGYGSLYYDETGRRITRMCGVEYKLIESYKGEPEKATKDVEEEEVEEEVEEEEDEGQTYSDLESFLDKDGTNNEKFSKSKDCATALISALENNGWTTELVKVVYKTGDKKYSRHIVEVETNDEGTVWIDSYGGIDKRVTQLETGKQWLAESACGTCRYDGEGKYNRGIVMKITYP